jgi:hypothetical protein
MLANITTKAMILERTHPHQTQAIKIMEKPIRAEMVIKVMEKDISTAYIWKGSP